MVKHDGVSKVQQRNYIPSYHPVTLPVSDRQFFFPTCFTGFLFSRTHEQAKSKPNQCKIIYSLSCFLNSVLQCFPTQLCRSDTSSRLQHWHIPDLNKNNKKISADTLKLIGENWKNGIRIERWVSRGLSLLVIVHLQIRQSAIGNFQKIMVYLYWDVSSKASFVTEEGEDWKASQTLAQR